MDSYHQSDDSDKRLDFLMKLDEEIREDDTYLQDLMDSWNIETFSDSYVPPDLPGSGEINDVIDQCSEYLKEFDPDSQKH